jgi:hypothetical protein
MSATGDRWRLHDAAHLHNNTRPPYAKLYSQRAWMLLKRYEGQQKKITSKNTHPFLEIITSLPYKLTLFKQPIIMDTFLQIFAASVLQETPFEWAATESSPDVRCMGLPRVLITFRGVDHALHSD